MPTPTIAKHCLFSILALVLGASAALAQGSEKNPEQQADRADGFYKIEQFTEIDVDRSGYIDEGEWQSYAFGRADWDDDGYLEKTEWVKYTEVYFDPYELDYDEYVAYDTDGDGFIDRGEFNDVPTAELYEAWDYDEDTLISDDDWDRVTTHYYDSQ